MTPHFMNLRLTQSSLDWFNEHNISFHNRFGSRLKIGDLISFREDLAVEPYCGFYAGNNLFRLGYMSYSNSSLPLDIEIGRYCSLAKGISIISYNHPWRCLSTNIFTHDLKTDLVIRTIKDFLPKEGSYPFVANPQKGKIVIENDVWIGQNSALMAGIKVGNGSIVAANSVVVKDVEPYSIVGGNPAKLIKFRFDGELIDQLLESRWWRYNYIDFHDLDISNPSAFLNNFSEKISSMIEFSPPPIFIRDCV